MDLRNLTLTPHPEAPDVLCGPDGLRSFIGASARMIDLRTAVANRIVHALRLADRLSNDDIEAVIEAIAEAGEGAPPLRETQPLEAPRTLSDAEIRELAFQHGFADRAQEDGKYDLNSYVYAFARDAFRLGQQVQP
jgi:hypothetical protein